MPRRITVNCVDPGLNDTGYADADTRVAVTARNPATFAGNPTGKYLSNRGASRH